MRFRGIAYVALLLLILAIGISRYGTGIKSPKLTPPLTLGQPLPETPGLTIPPGSSFPVTLEDMQGRTVVLKTRPRRIVSLSPGTTELLFDIGSGDRIVADTTACDWPQEAKSLPHIGGLFDMSLESILAIDPDLIVADGSINQKMIALLTNANQTVLVVQARRLADTYDAIRLLGRATGETTRADALVEVMQTRLEAVKKSLVKSFSRPKVVIIYGFSGDGVYTTGKGSFIDDLITLAGGKNIAQTNDPLSIERIILEEPDVILCDFALRDRIKTMPGLASLPAVKNTAFFEPSPNATLVRPSPRNAQAAWELARFLHPEVPPEPAAPAPSPPPASKGAFR